MLSIRNDPLSPERGQYGFLQDLVKRVAYDMLSRKDRRLRHLAAADYLAGVHGDDDEDVIEVIAAHRFDAYEAVPESATADEKRIAAEALLRAGERAASLGANTTAERSFAHAASLADDPLRRAELLERAGMMAAAAIQLEQAGAYYAEAEALFTSAGATHPAARVSARNAESMWDQGRLSDALASMDQAYGVLAADQPDADLATLAAQIGRFKYFSGEMDIAAERIEAALDIAETLGLAEVLSEALNTKALILAARDRRQEGRALLRHALEIALEHDKPSAALRAYNNLTDFSMQEDRYAEAMTYTDDGLLLARRAGNRYWEQILLGQIYPRYALGQWDEALARMDELLALQETRFARTAFSQGYLAFGSRIHIQRGDVQAGEQLLERMSEFEGSADAQERLEYGTAKIGLLAARGRPRWRAGPRQGHARTPGGLRMGRCPDQGMPGRRHRGRLRSRVSLGWRRSSWT